MSTSNLINPLIWQSTIFGDQDALLDFLGHHGFWHQALATATKTNYLLTDDLGGAWRSLLAQGLVGRENLRIEPGELLRHAQMHTNVAKALGIAPVYDLASYALDDRDSFAGFMSAHSLEHDRERKAANL